MNTLNNQLRSLTMLTTNFEYEGSMIRVNSGKVDCLWWLYSYTVLGEVACDMVETPLPNAAMAEIQKMARTKVTTKSWRILKYIKNCDLLLTLKSLLI